MLSPGDGYWGDWSNWRDCSDSSYVNAFRLRIETYQGAQYDDSGLNSIHLKCEDLNENVTG